MRIDAPTTSNLSLGTQGPDVRPQTQTGTWRGESVQQTSNSCDVLADAAEEITLSQSERAESRKLNQRRMENRAAAKLPKIDQIQKYLDAVNKGHARGALQNFVTTLKQRQRDSHDPSTRRPRDDARREFGNNVTEQFLALSFALETLEHETGYEALRERLRDDIEDLMDDFGGHIRADFNTVGAAGDFGGESAADVERFQHAYRDAVLGGENLNGMLRATLERFGEQDFARAVSHLIRALGDDLNAMHNASAEPARLNAVLQDLYLLEVLSTVLDHSQDLSARLVREHSQAPLDSGQLMQDLVSATGERWSTSGRFLAIADKHRVADLGARITFLTAVKVLVRDMPLKVFADPDTRFNVIGAVQEALDETINLEDE